jgi:hypothetical protein
MLRAFTRICRRLPPPPRRRLTPEIIDAPHLLTIWFRDRAFLNANGLPKAIPLRGGRVSLAALVRRINPALSPAAVASYLVSAGAVLRIGKLYAPAQQAVLLRGTYGPERSRALRPLLAMLRTLEHNLMPSSEVPGWFEWIAENPRVPLRALPKLDAKIARQGMGVLQALDIDMHEEEQTRASGEPVVRVGIGFYRFEEPSEESAGPKHEIASSSGQSRARRKRKLHR